MEYMPEIKTYTFTHTELAEVLIRKLDIHEGLWGISLEFNFTAANVPTSPDPKTVLPASITFVSKIGIQRFDVPTSLTVDAASVNPATPSKKKQ
jgi:hypothetical protein